MTLKKPQAWSRWAFCFYCGVDSRPLIILFVATMGLLILGAVCLFLWSVFSGQWARSEGPKYKVLEVESDGPSQ